MRKKLRYILFAVAAYLIFLLVMFPAAQAYSILKSTIGTDGSIRLSGISGTVWSGHAKAALIGGQRFDSLNWNLHPWALLLGRMQIDVGFRDGENFGRGSIARGIGGGLYLKNVEARLAIDEMPSLTKLLPIGLQGSVGMNIQTLELDDLVVTDALGTLAWQDAAVTVPQKTELGDLRVKFESDAQGVKATLADGGGPLAAEGVLLLKPDGSYQFTGAFASRDPNQRLLTQSLRLMGRPGPDGKVKVSQSGNLTDLVNMLSSGKKTR
jgi:general secretion pathway protein N